MAEDDILPEVSRAVEHVDNALSFQIGVIYRPVLLYVSFEAWAVDQSHSRLGGLRRQSRSRIILSNTMHL